MSQRMNNFEKLSGDRADKLVYVGLRQGKRNDEQSKTWIENRHGNGSIFCNPTEVWNIFYNSTQRNIPCENY